MRAVVKKNLLYRFLRLGFSFEALLSLYVLSGLIKSILGYYEIKQFIDLSLLSFIALVISFLIEVVKNGLKLKINKDTIVLIGIWIAFYCWILISLFYTPSTQYAYTKIFKFLTNFVFILVLLRGKINLQLFIRISIFISLVIMAWYIPLRFLYLTGYSPKEYWFTREFMGMYLYLSMPLGLFIITILTSNITISKSNSISLFVLATSILGIILMGARGPLLILFIILLLYSLMQRKINTTINIKNLFLSFFAILILIAIISPFKGQVIELFRVTFQRMLLLFKGFSSSNNDFGDSVNTRLLLLYQAINIIFSSPSNILFGTGIGSFGLLTIGEDIKHYPHNFILEIWCELGLVGLSIFVLLMLLIFRKIKLFKAGLNIYPLLYLLINFLKSSTLGDMRLFFVFMAIYFLDSNSYLER